MTTPSPELAARDVLARGLAIVGLLGVALIHVLDAIPTFSELPYKGWLYISLIVGSLIVAGLLVRGGTRRTWGATAGLALGAVAAFVYSRTVGLPGAADDVGNWAEPIGVAALFVEVAVLAIASYALVVIEPAHTAASRSAARQLARTA
jgi:hypothetical protein